MKKLNLKKPKYILPAILLLPLLFIGWNLIDMFGASPNEKKEVITQGEINTDIPEPNMENKDMQLKSKYQNMMDDFGKVRDYAAVQGIEADVKAEYDELGNSLYTDEEIAELDSLEREKQKRLRELNAMQQGLLGNNTQSTNEANSYNNVPNNDNQQKEKDEFAEQLALLQKIANGEPIEPEEKEKPAKIPQTANSTSSPKNEADVVHKATKINTSNFNTIQKNKADGDKFIKAMLDESIKAEAGSRLRIRLLDDIEIDGNIITKGSYLYAIVNGFSAQRIQANITSIFVKNELLNVSLSIYDNDGIEGFYVPASAFRDFQKDVGSQALQQNINMNSTTGEQNLESMAFQTLQSVYQSTTQAVSNNIRKNKAKLKYNTEVYLINKNKNQ